MKNNKIKIGDKFFDLIVIDIKCNNKEGEGRDFICRCKCGNNRISKAYCLNRGQVKSCGCKNNIDYDNSKFDPIIASLRSKVSHYKSNAKRVGRKFELTYEEGVEILKSNCHYCNSEPSNIINVYNTRKKPSKRMLNNLDNIKNYEAKYNGIDRIDSNGDYIKDNVVPCCTTCNFAKNTMSYIDFINWINRLIKYRAQL